MKALIDEHRNVYGVKPICTVLPMAPSTYRAYTARRINPMLRGCLKSSGRLGEPPDHDLKHGDSDPRFQGFAQAFKILT